MMKRDSKAVDRYQYGVQGLGVHVEPADIVSGGHLQTTNPWKPKTLGVCEWLWSTRMSFNIVRCGLSFCQAQLKVACDCSYWKIVD